MTCSFHPEAEVEFLEAINYYEERATGLGNALALEVYSALARIIAHPKAWPIVEGEIRRCLTGRFPYGILYTHEAGHIYVLAVMNLHRDPEYWKHRMP